VVGRALAALGLERKIAVEVPYFSLVPGLLRETDLVATLPRNLAELFVREHGLVALEPPVSLPPFGICLAYDPRFAREPGLEWFRAQVESVSRRFSAATGATNVAGS